MIKKLEEHLKNGNADYLSGVSTTTIVMAIYQFEFLNKKINIIMPSTFTIKFREILDKIDNNLDLYETIKNDEIKDHTMGSMKNFNHYMGASDIIEVFKSLEEQVDIKSINRNRKISKIIN
jgi:hypothetical protein